MNIFQNSAKSIPESDPMIVRVDMETQEIGGRKSHLPGSHKATTMSVDHVANANSNTGTK